MPESEDRDPSLPTFSERSGDGNGNGSRAGLPEISPDVIEQDEADLIDNIVPARGYSLMPMVGLGDLAGCIPLLQVFFENMPGDTGMVFVVILHLSA